MTGERKVAAPTWGYRAASAALAESHNEAAPPAGLGLLWGARVIAQGFDLPWDRHSWTGRDAGNTPARKLWHQRFLAGALDAARERARFMREDEVSEVVRERAADGWESVLIARKAGGYVYISAGTVPAGTAVA